MLFEKRLTLFAVTLSLFASLTWAASIIDDSHADQVDALFRPVARQSPGAAVLVSWNGKVLYERGFGLADVEKGIPIRPDTRFCIASVTKQFTAAAVLILAERGQVDIEAPVQTYLPDFSHPDITVRHLLNHTSGLPDFIGYTQATTVPLDSAPGTRLNYSNTGYLVLGKLIEAISGRSYEAFLEQNIFGPLSMKNTGLDSAKTVSGRARGYLSAETGYVVSPPDPMGAAFAAGGLYSTVEDLHLWDQAWYDGRLLQRSAMEDALRPARLNDGRQAPYGFGWMLTDFRGTREVSHGGDITGFNSFIARYPDQHFSVIVLSNTGMRPPGPLPVAVDLAHSIATIYLGDKLPPAPHTDPLAVDPAILRSYVGRYRLSAPAPILAEAGEVFAITLENGHLMGESKSGKGELLADSETMFHPAGFPVSITFVASRDGRVDELVFTLMRLREFTAHRLD